MAAVVTGNTTVLKPSPDAPTIAYKFMEVLEEVGLAGRRGQFRRGQRERASAS